MILNLGYVLSIELMKEKTDLSCSNKCLQPSGGWKRLLLRRGWQLTLWTFVRF